MMGVVREPGHVARPATTETAPAPRPTVAGAALVAAGAVLTYSFAVGNFPSSASMSALVLVSLLGAVAGAALAVPIARRRRRRPPVTDAPATLELMAMAVVLLTCARGLRRAVGDPAVRVDVLAAACAFAVAFVVPAAVLVRRAAASAARHRRHDRTPVRAARDVQPASFRAGFPGGFLRLSGGDVTTLVRTLQMAGVAADDIVTVVARTGRVSQPEAASVVRTVAVDLPC